MAWVFLEMKDKGSHLPLRQAYLLFQTPPPPPPQLANLQSGGFGLNNKVSPSILLIIIILAIIFFVSGLVHLLVRFLLRPPGRDPDDLENVTALQGQLQQLFHLHDAGVDQSYIDALPVFNYNAIIGVKNPLDCAVCLCEFEAEDKLRLLPKCSHAFHMDCIDTWLLSHSTCPLCRASLLPDFSGSNRCSSIVLVLESGSDSSREIVTEREGVLGRSSSTARANSHLGVQCDEEIGLSRRNISLKYCQIQVNDDGNQQKLVPSQDKVVTVKLGKFRNVDGEGEGSSDNNADARRCFSMGSFEYVMDDNSSLKVSIKPPVKNRSINKPPLPLTPGHRPAMSECDFDSRREFNGFQAFRTIDIHSSDGSACFVNVGDEPNGNFSNTIERGKKDSFSVSKIWLRGKKDKPNSTTEESSRRAFSFRFPPPLDHNAMAADEFNLKAKKEESELGYYDEENQSRNSLDYQSNSTSFGKWASLWLIGRQNKVVHPSSTPSA